MVQVQEMNLKKKTIKKVNKPGNKTIGIGNLIVNNNKKRTAKQ